MKVKLDMFQKGFLILNPETEHAPFDMVGYRDGKFLRVQVKYRAMKKDVVIVPGSTSWSDKNGTHTKKYDLGSIDLFAVYVPDLDKCFYIPKQLFSGKKTALTFRTSIPRNNQSNYNFLFDFENVPE